MILDNMVGLDQKSYDEYQDALYEMPKALRLEDVDRRVVNSFVVSKKWLDKLYSEENKMLTNRSTLHGYIARPYANPIWRVVALTLIAEIDDDLVTVRDMKSRVRDILHERQSQLTFRLGADDDLPF